MHHTAILQRCECTPVPTTSASPSLADVPIKKQKVIHCRCDTVYICMHWCTHYVVWVSSTFHRCTLNTHTHLQRSRSASKHDGAAYHCDCCNQEMRNVPETIHSHNTSAAHKSQQMMLRDSGHRPDGSVLAGAIQQTNAGSQWIMVPDKIGGSKRKLTKGSVKIKQPSSVAVPDVQTILAAVKNLSKRIKK